jgi:uncharacterized protein (TIGR02265 family)
MALRVKGIALLQLVKGLRAQRQRAAEVLDERYHSYFDQLISLTAWYPEEDHLALLKAMSQILPPSEEDPWTVLGRTQASGDLRDTFSYRIEHGHPWRTLRAWPDLYRLYYDQGHVKVTLLEPGHARIEFRNFESIGHEGMAKLFSGFLAEMLSIAGAQFVEAKIIETGSAERAMVLEASWKEEA